MFVSRVDNEVLIIDESGCSKGRPMMNDIKLLYSLVIKCHLNSISSV